MIIKEKCLVPECDLTAVCRGLCNRHYSYVQNVFIRKGKTTWAALEKAGKAKATTRTCNASESKKFFTV
jgi:hypothetical protein